MKLSHLHCSVRDLRAAALWFEKVWQISPVFNNERMVWLSFGELGVILDAATDDSIVTIGFDSKIAMPTTVWSRAEAQNRSKRKTNLGAHAPLISRDRADLPSKSNSS